MANANIYLVIFIYFLIQFLWYYATLPGSELSLNKKHPKSSIKIALTSYLIYLIPVIISLYYLNSKDSNCAIINAYAGLICKK